MTGIKHLFQTEQNHLNHFFNTIDLEQVEKFFKVLSECTGLIFFSGIGKSGLIAKKIAVTMTSTGTRALYLSPVDALHGDIGLVSSQDIFIFLSKSGESDELLSLVPYLRNKGATLMAIVSNPYSRLGKLCSHEVILPVENELCPFNLAPTTSTTVQLIFGDILAVALMEHKNFTLDQYSSNHPAGRIGKRILLKVKDLMITGDQVPLCLPENTLQEMIVDLSNKRAGCLIVADQEKNILGIFTDGDLRRALQKEGSAVLQTEMGKLMTKDCRTVSPQKLAWEAMQMMEANQNSPITIMPVVEEGKVVGIIKMHDILQSGL